MNKIFKSITLLFFMIFANSMFGTHLVGGYISYEYVGESSSGVRYLITITSYRDCNKQLGFPDDIEVCAYNRNNLQLASSFIFRIKSRTKVQPVGRTDCPETTSVCLEKGIFQELITLPKSSFGYYVKWEICCRNEQVNLRNDASGDPFIGQTYQTIIPPSNVKNSSPVFIDVPVPFICLNDTVQLNNYAVDPDGNTLVYKLATPWYGASLSNNYPGCSNFYQPPEAIKPQDYTTGYNGNIPFGVNGIAQINSSNGVATFKATKVGNYAIAIDLEEYDNSGNLISTTRLDLQILVIECKPNNKPTLSVSKSNFEIQAGEKLCFNVTGNDKDLQQNLTLNGFGNILTGANGFRGNRGTFAPAFGKNGVTSEFCWQTSCDQASDTPYLFTARVVDDGCPSKFTITNYSIKVNPFTASIAINGPLNVCQGSKGMTYPFTTSANTPSELIGITYDINIVNGVLKSQTANSLVIDWNSGGNGGKIEITPTSQFGCPGKKTVLDVAFIAAPPAPVLNNIDTVCENTNKNYNVPAIAGYTYRWWVENGSILGSNTNNTVNITWAQAGNALAKVVQYNANGCSGDTSYLEVFISKPGIPEIFGKKVVCPNAAGIEYVLSGGDKGSSYFWTVTGGTFVGSQIGNGIIVNWGNPGQGNVNVYEIDRFGCRGDLGNFPVLKGYDLLLDTIVGDTSICENTLGSKYSVSYTPATVYSWSVIGGTIVNGQGSNEILVDWGIASIGSISVYESSFDTVNNRQCVSNVFVRTVHIRPYPTANQVGGVNEICQSNSSGNYSLNGMVNSKYLWRINGDSSQIVGQGTNTIQFSYQDSGVFNLTVQEISEFGCEGQIVNYKLVVHPRPNTSMISGPTEICYPDLQNHNYSVLGLPSSTFNWIVDGGVINNTNPGNSINVSWSGQQNNTIKLIEISDFGCPGDTVRLDVFYDHPSLILDYITVNPPPQLDNGIDLFWQLNNAPRYNQMVSVERRIANSGQAFETVGSVDGSILNFKHSITNNDSNAWEYRLRGTDLCGNALYSNIHTNVFLKGNKPEPYSVSLDFTPYFGWGNAQLQYDVYRRLGNGAYELYQENVNSFDADYSNGLEYYSQCYRIQTKKLGTDTVTWSNDICFNFEPVLFIPDAFSPNEDDFNDSYGVTGGALKSFDFYIYNRWGERLFITDNINFRWDGNYKGQPQPQDVYMYICYYTGFDGRRYSTKGTITLLR